MEGLYHPCSESKGAESAAYLPHRLDMLIYAFVFSEAKCFCHEVTFNTQFDDLTDFSLLCVEKKQNRDTPNKTVSLLACLF